MQQHGVKRVNAPESDQALAKRKAKEAKAIEEYREACEELKQCSSKRVMDKSKLPLTARVIELNPEMPTAWSYRRRLLLHVLAGVQDSTESQQILSQDILLTLQALRQNPKNYSVWEHRKWLLRTMPQPDWRFELGLVNKFLEADARNFHGWDYRRHILSSAPNTSSAEKEFEYTTSKIMSSFSNFSAWHYRSKLLSERLKKLDTDAIVKLLDSEFELVRQALYTDPADQSGWFYHRWLVEQYPLSRQADLLQAEIQSIAELAELDEGELTSRWALNTLAQYWLKLGSAHEGPRHAREALRKLIELDGDRRARYESMMPA